VIPAAGPDRSRRTGTEHDPDLGVALALADIADSLALQRFRGRLHVDHKADGSIVTDADVAVERALRSYLGQVCPGDSVLGEELGLAPGDPGRRWILDPIDGTRSFARGHESWGALIALERDGEVGVGVVCRPVQGRRWWAALGEGAWSDGGRRLQVSTQTRLSAARLCDDNRGSARWGPPHHPAARLALRCGSCRAPHDVPMPMLLAEGRAELSLQMAATWDLAPVKVIVKEAGGTVTDLEGRPRIDTGSALASNGHVHDQALQALRRG
jgi:histidinol-phosphatase